MFARLFTFLSLLLLAGAPPRPRLWSSMPAG